FVPPRVLGGTFGRNYDNTCALVLWTKTDLRGRLIGKRHVYTTGRIAVVKLLTVLPIWVSKLFG
ncbi:MAG: hypothetical protein UIJ82_09655, partial [Collinsella sp.]|nr:hypothetical protein [Collinsella sp.]